jgi:YfiH family protein
MTDAPAGARARGVASALVEVPVDGPVPRYEIPGWRERFGVVAGITGRGSAEPSGFDLGLWTPQPVGEVMRRWRALRQAEPQFRAHVMGHQVHGSAVAWHAAAQGWTILDGVDGHLTGRLGTLLLVTVADCIPVYLVVPSRRVVGLLHAGWRGTAGGILARAVGELAGCLNVPPAEIVMHCGVGICGDCYEVGSEVMAGCRVPHDGAGPWHLDLRGALAEGARGLGIEEISSSTWCSAHDRPRFFSHRASAGRDGRMVAYLGYPDPTVAVD